MFFVNVTLLTFFLHSGILFNEDVRFSWKLGELNEKRALTERVQTLPYIVGITDYQK